MSEFNNTSVGILEAQDLIGENGNKILKHSQVNKDKVYMTMVFANWCGPCKMAKPFYSGLSTLLDKNNINSVRLTAIDASDDSSLSDSVGVRGFPTFLIWKGGEKIKYSGQRNIRAFLEELSSHDDNIKKRLKELSLHEQAMIADKDIVVRQAKGE
jgi:thioredoxin 1